MIGLGIELQGPTVRMAATEGPGIAHAISDGTSTSIALPLTVARDNADSAMVAFWSQMLGRACGHLSIEPRFMLAPVVAVADVNEPETRRHLATIVRAGWRPPAVVTHCHALAKQALHAVTGPIPDVCIALVIGESSVASQGFLLDRDTRSLQAFELRSIDEVGHAGLVRCMLGLAGLSCNAADRTMMGSVLDFAHEISRADDRAIPWRGQVGAGFALPRVRLSDCLQWPEVSKLNSVVDELLAEAGRRIPFAGQRSVVVSGPGAAWPFAANAARRLGLNVVLNDPSAIAAGAAYVAREGHASAPIDWSSSSARDIPWNSRAAAPTMSEPLDPPWVRRRRPNGSQKKDT